LSDEDGDEGPYRDREGDRFNEKFEAADESDEGTGSSSSSAGKRQ
jgi:kexin